MRKTRLFLSTLFIFVLLVTGCKDLAVPTGVQIKTKAVYNFTVAEFEKDFSDIFSASKLAETINNGVFEFYDYNPGGNQSVQQCLIRMPLQEVPLDFSSYLESMDVGKNLEAMSFKQDITIPDLKIENAQEIDISNLNKALIAMVTVTGTTDTSGKPQHVNFTGFNKIIIENGSMLIRTLASGTVNLYSSDSFHSEDDALAGSPIATATVSSSGYVKFDLSGKTLSGTGTYIFFKDAGSGYDYAGILSEDTKIRKAENINQETPKIFLDPVTFPSNKDNGVVSCAFKTGSTIKMEFIQPAEWSGITIDKDVTFSGGINTTLSGAGASSAVLTTYENKDINATIGIQLKLVNANIDFSHNPIAKLSTEIIGIDSVTVKIPDSVVTSINVQKDLGASATTMVKKINWEAGCGIVVNYINTFPTGNDFTLENVKSDFIGLTPTTEILTSATSTKTELEFLTASESTTTLNSSTKVDFGAVLKLPGYDSTNKTFTVKNVEAGKKYSIEIDITPKFDWKSVSLNTDSIPSVSNTTDLDFNVISIFGALDTALNLTGTDKISDKLKMSSLKIHLFCEKPDKFLSDAKFSGTLALKNGDPSKTQYLLNNEVMPFSKEPELRKDEKDTVISTVGGGRSVDVAELLNTIPSGNKLKLDYNLAVNTGSTGEIEIKKEDLANSENTSLKITAMIILPFTFKMEAPSGEFNLDLMKIAGKTYNPGDPDLLGRAAAVTTEGMLEKFLSIIDNVSVSYVPSKKPILADTPVAIKIDLDGADPNGNPSYFNEQAVSISGGVYGEKPKDIMEKLIYPSIKLSIKNGNISIPRNMEFKTRIDLKIVTNGEPLEFGGGA